MYRHLRLVLIRNCVGVECCHATCICPYIYTSARLNLPATQTTNIVQNLNNQQTNTNTQLKHKLNTTEIGNVHRLVPISHHPLVVGLSRISEFLHCSEIGNVHRLVFTSLRVLQCQLQLPIYIYTQSLANWQVNQSSQICPQTGKGTNQHKHTTHASTHQNMCPATGRSAVFKHAIITHQILSKTFFREGDPSPAA